MKKILFALTMLALVLPAVPRANGDQLSVNLFYDNISGGSWIDVDDYGYGWQPDVAVNDPDWRPYADGYWAYTDYGWTWISYEDFGWATYHYGRWARLADYGWVWFPGADLEWGPAWVSWRTGGDQIGWAPLPPRGPGIVYEGRPIGGQVDIEFDIGPAYYNFVDIRYIGEPVLRSHIYASSYNVTYINQTVNVTNITVKNKVVYNYGPDYDMLSRHSARPIQRLKIERENNVDFSAAAKSGRLTKVQGDKLMLGAPQRIEKPTRQIAPPTVKTKVTKDKLKFERGWSVAGDEKAQTELKQKIKTQDLKKIPPPTAAGAEPSVAGAPAVSPTPMGTATPPVAGSQLERGTRKGKFEQPSPSVAASPAGALSSPTASPMIPERGKLKGKPGERVQPRMTAPPAGSPSGEMSPAGAEDTQMKQRGKGRLERGPLGPTSSPATTPSGESTTESSTTLPPDSQTRKIGKQKGRGPEMQPTGPMTGTAPGAGETGQGKHKGRGPAMEPPQPATGAAPGTGEPAQGKPQKGKKQKDEASPAPTP